MTAMSSLSFAVVAFHGAGERVGVIRGITTYPLKGARGQPLDSCSLFVGKSTPRDREYALLRHEHIATRWASAEGGGASDASAAHADAILATGEGKDPAHHSNKHLFHQLITDPSLADFGVELEGEHGVSILDHDTGRVLARADDVRIDAERRLVESLFAESLETASSDAPPAFEQLFGRSQQLAELEQLAAELSSPKPVPARSSSNGAKHGGGVDGSGAVGEHHREAAAALVEPLGELKRRMEGLEALLADEATGNLDSKTTEEVLDLFESLNQNGKTIVMITHEDEVAERAKRVIRLRDGMIESDELNR